MESLLSIHATMAAAGFRTVMLKHDAYISLPGPARVMVEGTPLMAITHSFSLPSPAGWTVGAAGRRGGRARTPTSRRQRCAAPSCWWTAIASPAVAARAAAAGAAGQLHVSPHEHLHEMCISPVSGAALRARRSTSCRRPWPAPSPWPTVRRCGRGWRRARGPAWCCMPPWTPGGAKPPSCRRTWTGPTRMGRSSCSPATTTPGSTVSWTMAAPTPP